MFFIYFLQMFWQIFDVLILNFRWATTPSPTSKSSVSTRPPSPWGPQLRTSPTAAPTPWWLPASWGAARPRPRGYSMKVNFFFNDRIFFIKISTDFLNILTDFLFDSSKYFNRFFKEILDISTNLKKSDVLTDFFIFDL